MDAQTLVLDFCRAVERRDPKALAGYFTPDAVYHNIPIAPVTGREAIEATLAQFIGPSSSAEFEVRAISSNGATVLTERVDRLVIGGKKIEIPVMGAFEVTKDGKISAWRDYFDMAMFMSQMNA
jgi:limonene-1,2-epoxide hydrolase